MACARWLFPVPGGPRNSASSRWAMNRAVASSWISARFIFLLNSKSKESSERSPAPPRACAQVRTTELAHQGPHGLACGGDREVDLNSSVTPAHRAKRIRVDRIGRARND